jgi:hypothetical protein
MLKIRQFLILGSTVALAAWAADPTIMDTPHDPSNLGLANGTVDVRQPPYNAKCDGTTDDAPAINAAATAHSLVRAGVRGTVTIVLPSGSTCAIGSAIKLYSGEILSSTNIIGAHVKALHAFTGPSLVELLPSSTKYFDFGGIVGVSFDDSATTGLVAVQSIAKVVTNSWFRDIGLNTRHGLFLDTYSQMVQLDNIMSQGPIEVMLKLVGNFNTVRNLDKEGETGASRGCYVVIGDTSSVNASDRNYFDHTLIEGVGTTNKCAISEVNAVNTVFHDTWIELSAYGNAASLQNTYGSQFTGRLKYLSSNHVVSLASSTDVYFETLDVDNTTVDPYGVISADSNSTYSVGKAVARYNNGSYLFSALNKGPGMNSTVSTVLLPSRTPVPGYSEINQQRDTSAQNLLINGAFEAGSYGWSWSTTKDLLQEYVTSAVDPGLMGQFSTKSTSGAAYYLYQPVAVPQEWVGQTLTISAKVKVAGSGKERASPYINGGGLAQHPVANAEVGSGWQIISQQFVPQSAGILNVGVAMYNLGTSTHSVIYVDDVVLAFGTVGMNYSNSFRSLEIGGIPVTFASTAPTNGTWPKGALVFNSNPSTSVGWQCTTAGSPGTWTAIPISTGFPTLVDYYSQTGLTSAEVSKPFYTIPNAGLYRITGTVYVTSGAAGGGSPTVKMALSLAGPAACSGDSIPSQLPTISSGQMSNCTFTSYLPLSQALKWSVNFGGSFSTPPTYRFDATVEQLR